jgi:hypothetical protein
VCVKGGVMGGVIREMWIREKEKLLKSNQGTV